VTARAFAVTHKQTGDDGNRRKDCPACSNTKTNPKLSHVFHPLYMIEPTAFAVRLPRMSSSQP
jgi:hypothetical protein